MTLREDGGHAKPLPALWPVSLVLALAVADIAYRFHRHPLSVQDDQTQHIVWFRRFLPHHALAADPISDFFLMANGNTYRAFYSGVARVGIDPVAVAWVVGLLCAAACAYAAHRWVTALGGTASTAAAAAILIVLTLGFRDDLATGSARAIGWPLLIFALWALAARRPVAFALVAAVGADIYPPVTVVALLVAGIDRLLAFRAGRDWRAALVWVVAFSVPLAVLLGAMIEPSAGGPMVSATFARTAAEFRDPGRAAFFTDDAFRYWITGARSGVLPAPMLREWPLFLLGLAGLVTLRRPSASRRTALVVVAAGLLLWIAAHATLFALYLPSRFPTLALTLAMLLLAAPFLGTLADGSDRGRIGVIAGLLLFPLFWGALHKYPHLNLEAPDAALMRRIRGSDAPGIVAGTATDLAYVPALANRAVWWAGEFALPYKDDYRRFMNARLVGMIDALTAPDHATLGAWIARAGIGQIVIDADLFDPGSPVPWWSETMRAAPGGGRVRPRSRWAGAWLARPSPCRVVVGTSWLFDTGCLKRLP